MTDYEIFNLGNLRLQSDATLRGAKLAYKTYGTLNAAKDNAIVFPTFFGGQHYQNEAIIGTGQALDPERYFIIVPNMMGNGLSSSPSNTPMPYDRARFPWVSLYDNVSSQHRLVTELFGGREGRAGGRLVDGGAADVPVGGAVSRIWWSASLQSAGRRGHRGTTSCFWRA